MSRFFVLPLLLMLNTALGDNLNWKAFSGSTAEAHDHVKSQPASQLWKWDFGGKLEIKFPAVSVPEKDGAFGMWFYNTTPCNKRLNIEFYHGKKLLGRAWYNLNFRYWRPLGGYYKDVGIKSSTRINRIVLTAPTKSGSARIDELRPVYTTKAWQADDIQPWIGNPKLLKAAPDQTIFSSHDLSLNRPYLPQLIPEVEITPQELKDLELVTKRADSSRFYDSHAPLSCSGVDELEKEFTKLGISEDGTGPALEFDDKPSIPLVIPGAIEFDRQLLPLFRKVAFLLRRTKGLERDRVADVGIKLCRYILVQGYSEGSGNVGRYGALYSYRYWPPTVFALRDDLKRAGLLDEMVKSVAWFSAGRDMINESPTGNCDMFHTSSVHFPRSIAMVEDTAERYQRFRILKRFCDIAILKPSPLGDDGTVHHHWGYHPAYGSYSVPTFVRSLVLPLEGTSFAISNTARSKLYLQAMAFCFQSDHGRSPINLPMRAGARQPLDGTTLSLALSEMDTPDRQMARLYLSSLNGRKTKDADRFLAEGLTPYPLNGHMTFNLAALAVHRRDNTIATAAGMLAGYRGLEIYGWMESNNYGRNCRNGSLFISLDGEDAFRPEGWNWNHIPGATNLIRSPAEIFEGYAMYDNKSKLAGGITIPEGNGVWGMEFKGDDVNFKQGIFFFDDRITVSVSNIIKNNPRPRNSPGGDAITTLFQQNPNKNGTSAWHEGNLLGDNLGNGYIIWKGAPQLQFQVGQQSWTYYYKRYLKNPELNPLKDMRRKIFRERKYEDNAKYYNTTQGEFALAYINHGNNPQERSCAYTILIKTDKAKLKEFAADPQMEVLCFNRAVHAVYDGRTKTTAYVIFAQGSYPKPLEMISCPAFVAVKDLGDCYEVSVSISDADDCSPLTVKLINAAPVRIAPRYPHGNTVRIPKNKV